MFTFNPRLLFLLSLALLWCSPTLQAQEIRKAVDIVDPAAASSGATVGDNYRIRANDVIEVKVYQEADLSGKVQVREDGTVSLPLINENVRVAGLSVTAVQTRIRALLAKDYVRDPRVTVGLAEISKIMFTVMGQVNRANTYAMPNNKPVSVLQAIGMAGGYTRLANPKKIYLKRVVGGQEKVSIINAEEMVRNPNSTIFLKDGDVIDVKESGLF